MVFTVAFYSLIEKKRKWRVAEARVETSPRRELEGSCSHFFRVARCHVEGNHLQPGAGEEVHRDVNPLLSPHFSLFGGFSRSSLLHAL